MTPPSDHTTPFGWPVVPEVKMISCGSSKRPMRVGRSAEAEASISS